jgi:phosphatidylinositol alpha-1,6-mannosyltransferase
VTGASLLVTNDFPPKLGGIQSYLYELWRRLPPDDTFVLTTPYAGDGAFDVAQPFRVERTRDRVLFPTRSLARRIDALAREVSAGIVFLDPMLPLGLLGARLRSAPYVVIAHGAEVRVPRRVPGSRGLARRVLAGAVGVVAAGDYPARETARAAGGGLAGLIIPPGVDSARFRPLAPEQQSGVRAHLGLDPRRPVVLGVSRLVPRKGFDVLLDAVAGLDTDVQVVIAGGGRDRGRLERRAERLGLGRRARFLGRVSESDLPDVYACADVFAMPCRDRWRGLEAEGFGIVFLEAAACGVPAIAGRTGGAPDAVVDGETGYVVEPRDAHALREALTRLLGDTELRTRIGTAARERAVRDFAYDHLAERLRPLAAGDFGALRPLDGA